MTEAAGHAEAGVNAVSNGKVLVVDDDAALAEMLTIVLRNERFDSLVCPTGDQAIGAFREYQPDVVLLDLMLPGKDGIDVCREIRAESGTPIVMLTAKGETGDVVLGLESGAGGVVVAAVEPGGPAGEAGLRRGDVIVEVDRHEVSDTQDLEKRLGETDERALLLVRRGDSQLYVPIKREAS